MCAFVLLTFLGARAGQSRAEEPVFAERVLTRYPRSAAVLLLLYATCWNIPYGGDSVKKGYLNVLLHYVRTHLHSHAHGNGDHAA